MIETRLTQTHRDAIEAAHRARAAQFTATFGWVSRMFRPEPEIKEDAL